jgi:hypothetical protein
VVVDHRYGTALVPSSTRIAATSLNCASGGTVITGLLMASPVRLSLPPFLVSHELFLDASPGGGRHPGPNRAVAGAARPRLRYGAGLIVMRMGMLPR